MEYPRAALFSTSFVVGRERSADEANGLTESQPRPGAVPPTCSEEAGQKEFKKSECDVLKSS